MKSWFLFGTGLFLGVLFGAVITTFFLMDDMTAKKSQAVSPAVASVRPRAAKGAKKVDVVAQQNAPEGIEAKPAAVAAEALDLDSLPLADEGVISTVKREDSATVPAPQPH